MPAHVVDAPRLCLASPNPSVAPFSLSPSPPPPYASSRRLFNFLFENHVGLVSWWVSPAPLQGFEFESTFLLSAAMFTMAGALPVLPGPCQLLWWRHINKQDGAIDM